MPSRMGSDLNTACKSEGHPCDFPLVDHPRRGPFRASPSSVHADARHGGGEKRCYGLTSFFATSVRVFGLSPGFSSALGSGFFSASFAAKTSAHDASPSLMAV